MSYAPLELKKLAIRLFKSGEYTKEAISKIVGYSVPAIKNWISKDKHGLPLSEQKRGIKPESWIIATGSLYVNFSINILTPQLKTCAKL